MDHSRLILSKVRSCVEKHGMIRDKDSIAVGLSGGRDSLSLLWALRSLSSFYPKHFTLCAVCVDLGFDSFDTSALHSFCKQSGVELSVIKTDIAQAAFSTKNPCSLCSHLRRGALSAFARDNGCTCIALGHHADDVAQTALMNLLYGGHFSSFDPVTDYGDIRVIRPLFDASGSLISAFASEKGLPVCKNPCPADRNTQRQRMSEIIAQCDRQCRGTAHRINRALINKNTPDRQ